ncbi:hypothetical protein DL752_24605 [Escherichia coli]|nr:hypothetical protein [Escherichia coli]
MDSVHHIWCPLFSQEFQDLPDGAETTLTNDSGLIQVLIRCQPAWLLVWLISCRQEFNSRLQVMARCTNT